MTITMRCALSELLVKANEVLTEAKAEQASNDIRRSLKEYTHNLSLLLEAK